MAEAYVEQLREVERTLKTVIRQVEVLAYNFADNGDGRLGPAALPPSPPEYVRNETTVHVAQQLTKLMAAMHARREAAIEEMRIEVSRLTAENEQLVQIIERIKPGTDQE